MSWYKILLSLVLTSIISINIGSTQDQNKIDSLKLLAQNSSDLQAQLSAYRNICWEYAITRTKLDTARMYADTIRLLSTQKNNLEGVAFSHFYYGLIGRFESNYIEALGHFEKYLEYFEERNDSLKMESGLFQMGVIHYNLGNYAQSLKNYYTILSIYENYGMRKSMGTTLHSVAHIQRTMKRYDEAIGSYEKSIEISKEFNNQQGLVMSLMSLGNTYLELDKNYLAEAKFLEANDLYGGAEISYLKAALLESLGNAYHGMGKFEKAQSYFLEAYQFWKSRSSKKDLAKVLNSLGENSTSLKNYKNAKQYLKESIKLNTEIGSNPTLLRNYVAMKELTVASNDLKGIIKYQDLYVTLKDSMFTKEKNKQLLELETKYKVEQQEQNIALLQKENQLQEANAKRASTLRKTLIASLIGTLVIFVLIIQSMRQRFKNQKTLSEKNEEIKQAKYGEELQSLEMKALRAQMNPHFLFNSLNSINTLILCDENDNASKYLTKFSKLVRQMLENSEQNLVSLKDELEMLHAYVQVENLRFNNKISYKIEVDESIDQSATMLPSMILQPFVENAIWHGLLKSTKSGNLTVSIREDEEYLYCSIKDNGIGREKSKALQGSSGMQKKSMGIKITSERLRLLTKQKINQVIHIEDLKDERNNPIGTEVTIQFPVT